MAARATVDIPPRTLARARRGKGVRADVFMVGGRVKEARASCAI
jgi:hypothetical protein